MDAALFNAAFTAGAIYIPSEKADTSPCAATPQAVAFTALLAKCSYQVDEPLFHALCHLSDADLHRLQQLLEERLQLNLNWAPLVRDWQTPVGVTEAQALAAVFVNILGLTDVKGVRLPCGHIIPYGTFPIHRYNGCPLCGKPFVTAQVDVDSLRASVSGRYGLTLWTEKDLRDYELTLLGSRIPLEGTQTEILRLLVPVLGVPEGTEVYIREISALAFNELLRAGREAEAAALVHTPADILRALWSEKTGYSRIIRPKQYIETAGKNAGYTWRSDYAERREALEKEAAAEIRLKYGRPMCRMIAGILENMPLSPEAMCENMHPVRGMWVRFIRALRLSEFARKEAYPRLRETLDRFYRSDYPVWTGRVESALLAKDTGRALALLSERPGTFARSLFSAVLHLGAEPVMKAFAEVADRVPLRLLVTLDMYADYCFDPTVSRSVRLPGGNTAILDPKQQLQSLGTEQIADIVLRVKSGLASALRRGFASKGTRGGTVYIAPGLFDVPVPIGERAVADAGENYVPQGTSFAVEGDKIRLFLHWGEGLPAQHLDMDLSAVIVYPNRTEDCAYFNLNPLGAVHSGDIQHIPDMVGAAEYVELDIPALRKAGALYVVFVVAAYTAGALDPTVKVGWMNSEYPMKVDDATGVAYDPATVRFAARVQPNPRYDRMVFGVFDIVKSKILWLELSDSGQTCENLDIEAVKTLMRKFESRMSTGELLGLRAEALGQQRVDDPALADEAYTFSPVDLARVAAML